MLPTWHSRACCYTRALSVLKRAVTFLSPFLREIRVSVKVSFPTYLHPLPRGRARIPIGVLPPEVHYTPQSLKPLYMSAVGMGWEHSRGQNDAGRSQVSRGRTKQG